MLFRRKGLFQWDCHYGGFEIMERKIKRNVKFDFFHTLFVLSELWFLSFPLIWLIMEGGGVKLNAQLSSNVKLLANTHKL